jgi:hypothetical protein
MVKQDFRDKATMLDKFLSDSNSICICQNDGIQPYPCFRREVRVGDHHLMA